MLKWETATGTRHGISTAWQGIFVHGISEDGRHFGVLTMIVQQSLQMQDISLTTRGVTAAYSYLLQFSRGSLGGFPLV